MTRRLETGLVPLAIAPISSATTKEFNVLFKSQPARAASVFTLCFVLAACGSGRGDGLAALTTSNAQLAAGDVTGTVDFLGSIESLVEDYDGMIEQQSELNLDQICTSGSYTVTIQDGGTPGVTDTGDSFRIDFDNCTIQEEGQDPFTMNGAMLFTAQEVTGSLEGAFTRRVRVDFIALSVDAGFVSMLLNGDVTHDLSSTDGVALTSVISGSSLSAFAQVAVIGWSGTLSNYTLTREYDMESEGYSVTIDATYDSSRLGGAVDFETTVAFTGTGEGAPSAGTMIVTGAEDATITLLVLDGENVQLLLDVDGDGDTDATINTDWDTINNEG